jgi:hypothetical protein
MNPLAILERLVRWFSVEPTIALLMIMTAVVMFGSAVMKTKETTPTFWQWTRRIIEGSVGAILFVGLLWAFRSIMNNNIADFFNTHGSLSDVSRQSAESIWGRPHTQIDLGYAHFAEVTVQEQVPQENPEDPPQYVDRIVRQHVPQNSITAFDGDVSLVLSERTKGYALYSGYTIDARYEYQVKNTSNLETEAEFDFALTPGQRLYDNFFITVDGEDMSGNLLFNGDIVEWTTPFAPGQERTIVVSYSSRGMASYYYQIPNRREIRNFELTLTIDRLPTNMLNYPDGILTPMNIEATDDGRGSILRWELDNAITIAGMGVSLPQPEQPGEQVLRVLNKSPYAITLLGAMVALTLLLKGESVNFLTLALVIATYAAQFLVMASVSDYQLGFWGAMIVGAAVSVLMGYLLFRNYPSPLLRYLMYGLIGFFTLIYPLSGLLPTDLDRNAFDGIVQFLLIVYLFGVALHIRTRRIQAVAA